MKSERISPFWVNGYQPFSALYDEGSKVKGYIAALKKAKIKTDNKFY